MNSHRTFVRNKLVSNSAKRGPLRFRPRLVVLKDRLAPAAGMLDPTWGADGKLTLPLGIGDDVGAALTVQGDGKMVVADYSANGNNDDFAVVRFLADGLLDPSFGVNGKVTASFGSSNDHATSVVVQPDGKIVVAGDSSQGGVTQFAVLRHHPEGGLDNSFDFDGATTTAFGMLRDTATALAIQPNGAIVVAGWSLSPSNSVFALARFRGDNRAPVALPAPFSVNEETP